MRFRSFICGFLLAIFLLAGFSVFAAESGFTRQINVNIGGVDIVMDGVKLFPKDVNGKPVLPVAFEGTTYVPLRFLSTVLDKKLVKVGNTIYMGNEQKMKGIYLSELNPVLKSDNWNHYGYIGGWVKTPHPYDSQYEIVSFSKAGSMKIASNEYFSVSSLFSNSNSETWGFYQLNGLYDKISGYYSIDDASTGTSEKRGRFEIFGDGTLLRQYTLYKGQPQYFEVSLKGVNLLHISLKGESFNSNFYGQTMPIAQTACEVFDIKLHLPE